MNLQELLKERKAAHDKADVILAGAERAGRELTENEQREVDMALARMKDVNSQIIKKDARNTMRLLMTDGKLVPGTDGSSVVPKRQTKTLSVNYVSALFANI